MNLSASNEVLDYVHDRISGCICQYIVHLTNSFQAKVHGSLSRAGRVKSMTPKVEKQEKKKLPKGRAHKRMLYTRRFVNVTLTNGKRRSNPAPSS